MTSDTSTNAIDLHWLPLGAGAHVAKRCVRIYEALVAARERRGRCDIYHAALEVHLDGVRYVIESAPVWNRTERGVVAVGPVGLPWPGRFMMTLGARPQEAERPWLPRDVSRCGDEYRRLVGRLLPIRERAISVGLLR